MIEASLRDAIRKQRCLSGLYAGLLRHFAPHALGASIDDIRHVTGHEVQAVVATRASIQAAIDKHHRLDNDAENISAQASGAMEAEEDLSNIHEVVEDAPIVKLVNVIITQAVADRASDIHIEPTEHDVRIQRRRDVYLGRVRPTVARDIGCVLWRDSVRSLPELHRGHS